MVDSFCAFAANAGDVPNSIDRVPINNNHPILLLHLIFFMPDPIV